MDTNILDLHMDTLMLIFEQLPKFEDKKNLARTHAKLWSAFCHQNRKDVKSVINFGIYERSVISHWDFFLEWWGSSLTKICNKYDLVNSGDLIEAAVKFCPNLEILKLYVTPQNLRKIENNLSYLNKLKEISIRFNYTGISRAEKKELEFEIVDLIKSMQSLPNLRILNFGNDSLTKKDRKELNKLSQLEELKIGALKADDVGALSNLLANLRSLKLECYPDTKTIKRLAKHCSVLESLRLSNAENRRFNVTFCPSSRLAYYLRTAYVTIFERNYNDSFRCNFDSPFNAQLQVLEMPFVVIGEMEMASIAYLRALKKLCCKDIHSSSIDMLVTMRLVHICYKEPYCLNKCNVMRLIEESKTLMILDCACLDINEEFLSKILDTLETKGFTPQQPFQFTSTTNIDSAKRNKLIFQYASMPKSNLMHLKVK